MGSSCAVLVGFAPRPATDGPPEGVRFVKHSRRSYAQFGPSTNLLAGHPCHARKRLAGGPNRWEISTREG
ncbi:hypothetical protein [Azospirillum endophyticum]